MNVKLIKVVYFSQIRKGDGAIHICPAETAAAYMEKPVCVTLSVESIQRGEEAYAKLQKNNSQITSPNENEEYIIAISIKSIMIRHLNIMKPI